MSWPTRFGRGRLRRLRFLTGPAGALPRSPAHPARPVLGADVWQGQCSGGTGRQPYPGPRLWRMKGSGPVPELRGDLDRIDAELFPPERLAARAVELAVMQATERDGEFVADLAAERPN